MYSIEKKIKHDSFTNTNKLILEFLSLFSNIFVINVGNIKLDYDNDINKLLRVFNVVDYSEINNLLIPENAFIWIVNQNTKIYSRELYGSLIYKNSNSDIIYFDEELKFQDKIYPFLKPCWSPIYFRYNNIGNAVWIKFKLFKSLHNFDFDLFKADISNFSNLRISYLSEILSITEVKTLEISNNFKPKFKNLNNNGLTSIIILTKDKPEYLERLVNSINSNTYKIKYEIIIVDHESKEDKTIKLLNQYSKEPNIKVIKYSGIFNYSVMNNLAVSNSSGDYLAFLNNDVEILDNTWITKCLSYLTEDTKVGVIGSKLIYPNKTIQHCGISVGIYSTAGHLQRGSLLSDPGYMNTLLYPHEVLAVTGAFMFITRKLFDEVGGFDKNYPVILNDVDLCLKVYEKGYRNIVLSDLISVHYEGVTRGVNKNMNKEDQNIISRFWRKWGKYVKNDPYFNKHFSRNSENIEIID